jgi:hypothetical protein
MTKHYRRLALRALANLAREHPIAHGSVYSFTPAWRKHEVNVSTAFTSPQLYDVQWIKCAQQHNWSASIWWSQYGNYIAFIGPRKTELAKLPPDVQAAAENKECVCIPNPDGFPCNCY